MPSKFDFLIIETYAELALVAASLFTVLSAAVFWLWRRRTRSLKRKAEIPRPFVPRRHISPLEREFDKIATVISGASDRANHISETQSAAAIKIDSTEMAIDRLVADLRGLNVQPRASKAVPLAPVPLPAVPLPAEVNAAAA